MTTYKEIISIISKNNLIPITDVYDYVDSPMFEEFNFFFEFYNHKLSQYKDFGIEPHLLFFKNDLRRNAVAVKIKDYYVIQIYMGLLHYLHEKFNKNTDLLTGTQNNEYIEFESKLDVNINELLYQNASNFTFYHEMAHLVQKSNLLENNLSEQMDNKSEYSSIKHLLEIDADRFSSICIGTTVVTYIQRIFSKSITRDNVKKILVIICSSALFYILSFYSNKHKLYFKENSHPHPVIRISSIVFHIVQFVKQYFNEKGIDLDITHTEIVLESIKFSNKISVSKFHDDSIEKYVSYLKNESSNISAYLVELHKPLLIDKTFASYKWNHRAEKLRNKI